MNDVHCHFFSEQFFATLGRQRPPGSQQSAADIVAALGWDPPGSPEHLADRWVKELDRAGVARAALIASVPGDEESVARAVARHPSRFVGFFMLDPTAPDAASRTEHALDQLGLRAICLFPAMQRYSLHDPRVRDIVQLAARARRHRCLRALRRAVGRRAQEARTAEPLRRALRQSSRSSRAGRRPSRRAVHHSALRRGTFPRSAARRRPLPKRVPRHVEHEPVDVVSPRARRCPASSSRRSRLPGRTGCCSAPTRRFFRADGTGGLRRAGKRARGRGRRRECPPSNFHR